MDFSPISFHKETRPASVSKALGLGFRSKPEFQGLANLADISFNRIAC